MPMNLRHRIAHITDTHVAAEGLLYGALDSFGNLGRALDAAAAAEPGVDLLLLTGDLADLGEPAAYARVRGAVEAAAEALGVPAIYGVGNHDDRAAFRAGLLDQEPSQDPIDYVAEVDGLRIVVLDSTAVDGHHGEVLPGQLEWLATVLAEPAEHGTVLTLHHPPLYWPDVYSPLDGGMSRAESAGIGDPTALGDVVRGTDVRVIVSGHLHDPRSGMLAGIPVWAGASSANAFLVGDTFQVLPSSRMSFIDLYDDGNVVASIHDLAPPPSVLDWSFRQLVAHYGHAH